jgi:hypothetical protein
MLRSHSLIRMDEDGMSNEMNLRNLPQLAGLQINLGNGDSRLEYVFNNAPVVVKMENAVMIEEPACHDPTVNPSEQFWLPATAGWFGIRKVAKIGPQNLVC